MDTTKRLRSLLYFGLLCANLAVFASTGYSLLQTIQQFEDRAETLSQNVVLAVAQNITGSLEKIDVAMSDLKWEIESSFDVENRVIGDDFIGPLNRLKKSLPEVEAVRVVDSKGLIVLGSGLTSAHNVNVADREYFAYYRERDENRLHLSKPLIGRVIKARFVTLGRRLNYPDGTFAGIVYAIVTIDYINRLLASFELGEHGTITLRESNLALITRWPPLLSQLEKGIDAGTISNTHSVDGARRTVSFRRLRAFPLLVVAGVAPQDYLEALWGERLYIDLSIVFGFSALSFLVTYLSLRLLAQSDRARLARDESLDRLKKIASRVPPDGRVKLLHLWPGKLPHLNCGKTGGLWGSFDGAGNARAGLLESVAFSLELKHMGVMHQAIEDSRGHGGIAEILSPVLDNAV